MERLLPNIHFLLIFVFLYFLWTDYEEYELLATQSENALESAKAQLAAAKKKAEKIDIFKENLEAQKRKVADLESQIEELQKKLPSEVIYTQVLDFLVRKGKEVKLKDVRFEEGEETERGFYYAKKFTMSSDGTFLQFIYFFNRLFNAEQLYNIASLKMESDVTKRKGRFQIVDVSAVIETYKYNEQFEEGGPQGQGGN